MSRRSAKKETPVVTLQDFSKATLKRLHTLGNQRFGAFPFSANFDLWLANVTAVLFEFESHPTVTLDSQFLEDRSQVLTLIETQLESHRQKESTLDETLKNLSALKERLTHVKTQYVNTAIELRRQKNSALKSLYRDLTHLKKDQDAVIQMKTGFLRGVSRKEREQKEIAVTQELTQKQQDLELTMLDFSKAKGDLQTAYEEERAPLVAELKKLQKTLDEAESDGSLEDRWFACEALADAVNAFLQRSALKQV